MPTNFFDYEGITFNRTKILVISGPTINPNEPGHEPYFRIVLENDVEWHITAQSETELLAKRNAFITALSR